MKHKLLIIGPSLKMGGIERASVNIANFFSVENEISFAALFAQNRFFELNPKIQFFEPEINRNKLDLIKSIFWIRRLSKKIRPEAILVFNLFYGAIVCLALVGTGLPVFVSDRASALYQWPKRVAFFNFIIYKLCLPSGVIAQTALAAEHQALFFGSRTRIKIIPNAIRDVQVYPLAVRKNQILAVGRLNDPLKGFDRLVEAFSKLNNKDWELVFAGGDEEGNKLRLQAAQLGIGERVIFLGRIKDIDKVYAESGIFVAPSRSEGFPNALCEAMAAGLPCISFDFTAGPRDIIHDGHDGYLVENGDIEGLAQKIDFLIENPNERKRLSGNAVRIREKLSVQKIGKEYLNFILSCK